MTEEPPQVLLPKSVVYVKNLFRINEESRTINTTIRLGIKWLFDFLRNVMLVGVVIYLGKKTDHALLKYFGGFLEAMLFGHIWTYFEHISFNPFHRVKNFALNAVLNILNHVLVIGGIWLATIYMLTIVTNEIAKGYLAH